MIIQTAALPKDLVGPASIAEGEGEEDCGLHR